MKIPDGAEEGVRYKRPRSPAAHDLQVDPQQDLDDRDSLPLLDPDLVPVSSPSAFLSPSVKEYLELGKSIPGIVKRKYLIWNVY